MKSLLVLSAILFLTACTSGSNSDPGSGDSSLRLERQVFEALADSSGRASFTFSLPTLSASFQLAASSGSLIALSGPQGDLLNRSALLSSFQLGTVSNLNYYSPTGVSTGSYNASYSASAGTPVTLQVSSKRDDSLASGTLKLNLVLLGPVGGSQDILDALDKALEAERITFGRVGIALDTVITNFDGPSIAPPPGDPLYQSIVEAQRPASITVVIASDKQGSSTDQYKYGTIGSTPFPVVPNANSVIIISIDDVTGGDGIFNGSVGGNNPNDDQYRILGEEIGRFTSQALGLPNIVEIKGSNTSSSDNLSDTPSCLSKQSCQKDSESRSNLMYPQPLPKTSDDQDTGKGNLYYPRDQLTSQQGQVLNNSVFVD